MNSINRKKNNSKFVKFLQSLSETVGNPIFITIAFAPWAIFLYFGVTSYFARLPEQDTYLFMGFIEWFGGVYGLFIVLVLLKTWLYFENVDHGFDRESVAFWNLINSAIYISKNNRSVVIKSIFSEIENYCIHIIQYATEEASNERFEKVGNQLLMNLKFIASKIPYKEKTQNHIVELNNAINEVFSARRERLTLSKHRTPRSIWFLAVISSILWLFPFYTLVFTSAYLGIIIVGGVTFVILFLLLIIQDLNDPFHGIWSIKLDAWEEMYNESRELVDSTMKAKM